MEGAVLVSRGPRSIMTATPAHSDDNLAMCMKGFVLSEPDAERPRVTALFIFPLS